MTGHLIHIGYPKAGTSYLQRWFEAHPQLAYAQGGIASFGSVYEMAGEAASPREGILYRVTSSEVFAAPRPDVTGVPVEVEQARTCATLSDLFPAATVLIVTRGFRSMILSSFSQYVRTGGPQKWEEMIAGPLDGHPWNYDFLIRLYRDAFGPEKVIVLPYELLRDDAQSFVRQIERRLGLAPGPVPRERVNASLSPVELGWYPRIGAWVRRLPLASGPAFRLFRRAAFANRLSAIIRLLQLVRPLPPVSADLIPDDLLDSFRGKAACLNDDPHYAAYATEYLFAPAESGHRSSDDDAATT